MILRPILLRLVTQPSYFHFFATDLKIGHPATLFCLFVLRLGHSQVAFTKFARLILPGMVTQSSYYAFICAHNMFATSAKLFLLEFCVQSNQDWSPSGAECARLLRPIVSGMVTQPIDCAWCCFFATDLVASGHPAKLFALDFCGVLETGVVKIFVASLVATRHPRNRISCDHISCDWWN